MRSLFSAPTIVLLGSLTACAADGGQGSTSNASSQSAGSGGAGGSGDGGAGSGDGGDSSGSLVTTGPGSGGQGGGAIVGDPKTCEQAAQVRSYVGCEFWPTVTANVVWSIFDFAVVVANAGDEPAQVTVSRGGASIATATVPANGLEKIYLPWVSELKGPDWDACSLTMFPTSTARVPGGAYQLTSTIPVTVYQFSALEYGPQGGPPGKDWSTCAGPPCGLECFSYSNDASLLLPSTALTANYRVTGYPSSTATSLQSYVTITGLEDGTNVTVSLGPLGGAQGGSGIPGGAAGSQVQFPIAAGEVVQLFTTPGGDLSGALVQGDKPIQVIHGDPCRLIPETSLGACDHLEESVLPAETLGQHYIVTRPTGPSAQPVPHVVRFVGNVDGTTLSYPGASPPGAPTSLNAGQVVDLGLVSIDFEVQADKEFSVGMFQQGATAVDPNGTRGDPAQSAASAIEQYRKKYVFLAPSDYDMSFVDVVMPMTATVTLDGAALAVAPVPLSSGFGVARAPLSPGGTGAHVIEASEPVGIQVMGYGSYTSYQFPGGLNLDVIAPPPPPPPPPN